MSDAYAEFLDAKSHKSIACGFEPPELGAHLFPFQRDIVRWALRKGRAAIFADTGLGKTASQLEWAHRVAAHTGGKVLILAPLAVAAQTVREGGRCGIMVTHCREPDDVRDGISITNYDRVHKFDAAAFVGVVLDEGSIIKSFNSKTLAVLLESFARTPYRLIATATPSPNDYTELGNHAEFLGICTRTEMLAEYFVHDSGDTQTWRLKGHARAEFWKWVASWAALVRRPSDLGYDDTGYILPPLRVHEHTVQSSDETLREMGVLFASEAGSLTERRGARKASIGGRVEKCAAAVLAEPDESWVIWCELNDEGKALRQAIPGSVEISGADDSDVKERRLTDFAEGRIRVLISKVSIAGFGLNWQFAARMAFVGVNDSFESYYQAVRREWRFGQKREVHVHIFSSDAEGAVVANLKRKERDAVRMADELSQETLAAVQSEVKGSKRTVNAYAAAKPMARPTWLRTASGE